jgi:TolB protein
MARSPGAGDTTPLARTRRAAAFALALALLALAGPAPAAVTVTLGEGTIEPLPVAISDFHGASAADQQTGRQIVQVIAANLERSGIFQPLDKRAFIQNPASLQNGPNWPDWQILDAVALVSGAVETQGDGRLRVEFRLWDVLAEQQLTGLAYFSGPENWRLMAHKISDAIYKQVTGEDGYFETRIVYVSERGPLNAREKRLAIMDQDGGNHQFLTDGSTLVLTPRFSPTAQEITYLAYYNNRPRVYLYNIDTARQEVLGDFPGMTFAPRFSPDGNKVIMSLAIDGNSDIYTMDLRTREVVRLTTEPGIETSPSYSPDGARIVFESDRGGSQQVYVMRADGTDARRISFGQGRYAGPVWSPRGDLIAFTKLDGGRFQIGVMRPDGTGERILSDAFHVEGPTWAPNGRVLMYFSETPQGATGSTHSARLIASDLTGRRQWTVPTPEDGSDPAWSPLIP